MGFNIVLLKLLCDRYVIPKLVSVKVQGKVMYLTKDDYKRMSIYKPSDEFIFELSKVKVGDHVLSLFKKFYVRPSKKTYKVIVKYCKDRLDENMLTVIFHSKILAVMDSLKEPVGRLSYSLLKRK